MEETRREQLLSCPVLERRSVVTIEMISQLGYVMYAESTYHQRG
jgi:hypothetical protein